MWAHSTGWAQSTGDAQVNSNKQESSIYVIDMRRLVKESRKGQSIQEKLKKEAGVLEVSLAGYKSKMQKLQQELTAKSALLSEGAKKKKQEEFEALQKQLSDAVSDAQENLALKEREALNEFVKAVDAILLKWSKSHPKAIVLEKDPSFVVYAKESVDITETIKKMLG
jgi:outer membrane protein